jgi:hypothetical protein
MSLLTVLRLRPVARAICPAFKSTQDGLTSRLNFASEKFERAMYLFFAAMTGFWLLPACHPNQDPLQILLVTARTKSQNGHYIYH